MIKAVILDLGGVYFTDGRELASKKIAEKYHLVAKNIADIMTTSSVVGKKYRRGEITSEEFWEATKKMLLIDAPTEELNTIWIESYEPIEKTVAVVKALKDKGIKLYYLSDSTLERVEYLQGKYNFKEHFKGGIFSHEAGLTKLDGPRMFRLVLDETGEDNEEVIYVDDQKEYVDTAKSLRMQGIHFQNPKQFEKELKKLGVKF